MGLLAILAGMSIVISRTINANLASKIGIFQGTIFNYLVGLVVISVPWWTYLGGIVGVLVVSLSSYITPRISAFYLTILIFISQLFVGTLVDYALLGVFSHGKIIGGLLVFVGLTYNLYLDKQEFKGDF